MFIATGAGSGYLPWAPGTWGSMMGVLLWLLIARLEWPLYCAIVGVLFVVGVFSAGAAEKIVDRGDPSLVVIDEIVGQMIVLTATPPHPVGILAAFALFRFFDILKPFPVSWLDRCIHGGLGIMIDDLAAALYALISLKLFLYWMPLTSL